LGHIVLVDGIEMDIEKIEGIRGCPMPKKMIEVRLFMGIYGYYQRFIKRFSNIVSTITYLQKKGVKFEWNSKCEENFQQLKEIWTSASILKIANPDEDCLCALMHERKGLVEFLVKRIMWYAMSPEN
jgi:hypothetical protein